MDTTASSERLKEEFTRLKNDEAISADVKSQLLKYGSESAKEYSASTLSTYLSSLRVIFRNCEIQSVKTVDQEQIDEIYQWIQNRDVQPSTVKNYNKSLKSFFNWYYDNEVSFSWVNQDDISDPDVRYLSEPEVYNIIQYTNDRRLRAFFEVLWLTGLEVGQLLEFKLTDIQPTGIDPNSDGPFSRFVVDGLGTQNWPEFKRSQVPNFQRWYRSVSERRSNELWIDRRAGDSLSYDQIRYQLTVGAEAKDIASSITPGLFRKSRIINLVRHGHVKTKKELRQWFQWSENSDTATKYWEQGKQVQRDDKRHWTLCEVCDAALLSKHQECYRCETLNPDYESTTEDRIQSLEQSVAKIEADVDELSKKMDMIIEEIQKLSTD